MFRTLAWPLLLVLMLVAVSDAARADDAPSAADIVAAADRVRNPQNQFRLSLVLVEYQSGQAHDSVGLSVHARIDPPTHQYGNLVRYTAPARDAASDYRAEDVKDAWFQREYLLRFSED